MTRSETGYLSLLTVFLLTASGDAAEGKTVAKLTKSPASAGTNWVAARGPVIEGEQFRLRQILDPIQGGIPLSIFSAPDKWRDRSEVVWKFENMSNPVSASAQVENPANAEAFYLHPAVVCFCLRPDAGYFQPGQLLNGLIYTREILNPVPALAYVVQQLRGNLPEFTVVGQRDLPELAKVLRISGSSKQRGVGVKVTYQLEGKPIEEEFYAIHDSLEIPYDGPQGRTWQVNWGLQAMHSFRAPAGKLEPRRPVFTAIAKSFRPNPVWQQRLAAANAYLAEQFNRQLQAGYDQIAAAGAMSRAISASNDAMIAAIDRQLAASKSSGATAGSGRGRSQADEFSDYLRGVDTVKDPYYGTSQHSSTEQYHWTDGYGTYRHSSDPTADPNRTELGTWQRMELAK